MLPPSWKAEAQKAIEETANADREQRERHANDAASKITAAINTLSDAQKAQTSSEDRNEQKDRAINIVTLFLVLLTVIFTFLTWRTLSGQLDEMKGASVQTNKLIEANAKLAQAAADQAVAASKQAEATDKEATAMEENAKVAHDNMIASERAWVGPRNASIDGAIQVGKDLGIIFDYANTGKEPANNFVPSVDGFTETTEEDTGGKSVQRIFEFFQKCQASAPSIIAGQVVFPSTGFSSYNLSAKIKADFIDQDFVDGKTTLIVQGCFLYASFEIIRHTYFCYLYKNNVTKPSNLSICLIGHYAD